MLKNGQTNLKSCVVHTARFLRYVWPFFNIMKYKVNPLLTYVTVTLSSNSFVPLHDESENVIWPHFLKHTRPTQKRKKEKGPFFSNANAL